MRPFHHHPSVTAMIALTALLSLSLPSCSSPDDETAAQCEVGPGNPAVETLQWKRAAAVESDLAQALELDADELCRELDLFDCVELHRVSLGASNPLGSALYQPVARPLATTATALDRVIFAACAERADQDAAGSPVVFTHLTLTGDAPASASTQTTEQIHELYRRFHRRDATGDELAIAGELTLDDAGQPVSARDFAALACFAIASTSEFLLF